jgi:penicillin-binding protein 1A
MAKERPYKAYKRRKKKRGFLRWMVRLAVVGVFLGAIAAVIGYFVFESYTKPYRERAEKYDLEAINVLEKPSFILDRNGEEIGRIFVENRSVIPLSEVSDLVMNTLVAGEDSRFWSHDGVDYIGVVRAGYENWKADGVNQGASTITQQLVRNAYNLKKEAVKNGESAIQRKMVEAFLAQRLEKRFKKREIMEFYLNRIYFGSGYYGIRSAALGYFGKEPKDLSQVEAASLIGLIKNPNNLNPLRNPEENRRTRDNVLSRLADEGMITRAEAKAFMLEPVVTNPRPLQRGTTQLYERVARELREKVGEEALSRGGFKIFTTIDKSVQDAAMRTLEQSLAKAEAQPGYMHQKMADFRRDAGKPPTFLQGAVLMIDHNTGEVLAHVGGRDFTRTQYDFIESGRRPLGTAYFPFIYTAGLLKGVTPASTVSDEAMDNRSVMVGGREGILGEWGMETKTPSYEGDITLRRALAASKIAATVRFGSTTGLKWVRDVAAGFGFHFNYSDEMLPRELVGWEEGTLTELVRAYAVFGRGGREAARELVYLTRIEDENGKVFLQQRQVNPEVRVIDEATAFQIHSILNGSLSDGSAAGADRMLLQQPFLGGGKTGTTHDFSDNWFVGYDRRVSCGVWVGFLQGTGQPIYEGAFSRDLAMPVWVAAMNAALPSFGGEALAQPATISELPVCSRSGKRATRSCYESIEDPAAATIHYQPTTYTEYFRKGTAPTAFCDVHGGDGGTLALDRPTAMMDSQTLRVAPIRPTKPVLIGDDPYFSVRPNLGPQSDEAAQTYAGPSRSLLDRPDLGDEKAAITLPRPKRLVIEID